MRFTPNGVSSIRMSDDVPQGVQTTTCEKSPRGDRGEDREEVRKFRCHVGGIRSGVDVRWKCSELDRFAKENYSWTGCIL